MITASGVDRVEACPASEVYPHLESESPDAERGRAIHVFIEASAEKGREAALAEVPEEWREACEAIDLGQFPTHLAHEVAFAYDVATGKGRELGRGLKRRYDVTDTEIPGTADVVGLDDERVVIFDYKGPDPRVPRARDSGQLKTLALAACRTYDRSEALIIFQRIRGGDTWRDSATLDIFDLDEHHDRLVEIRESVADAKLDPRGYIREGKWCRYCPAMAACPAKQAIARQVEAGDFMQELAPLTPETAPGAYRKLRLMEDMVKRVREHVYGYAKEFPIDLGDGIVFGPQQSRGSTKLDGEIIHEIASEMFDAETADKMVTRHATQKAIGDALNGVRGKTALVKELLARAHDRGGAWKTEGSVQLKEHKR